MPTPLALPNPTPQWPYNLGVAIDALHARGLSEVDTLATLAGALTLLGHPAQVCGRYAHGSAWEQNETVIAGGRRQAEEADTLARAIVMGERVLSPQLDASWGAILRRHHRAWRPDGFDAAHMDWESRYSEPMFSVDGNAADEIVLECVALLRRHPTQIPAATPARAGVTPEVMQVLKASHYGDDMLAGVLADALRQQGLEAKAFFEANVSTFKGTIETQTSCWVDIGTPATRLWFSAPGDELNLQYVTPNPRGAWGRAQLSAGVREINAADFVGSLQNPQLPYLHVAPLVSRLVQAHLEATVAPAATEASRPRM